MGIEARCPNGHRIRVKDRFAGQRVYCPECAAKFRVPMPAAAVALPTAEVVSLDAAYAATLPRAMPAAPAPAAVPPPTPAPGRLHHVIAEAYDLTWHVALPGGDPSEPLTAVTLQEWLDGGNATGRELVWRTDWSDWVPIRLVFPEHVPKATA